MPDDAVGVHRMTAPPQAATPARRRPASSRAPASRAPPPSASRGVQEMPGGLLGTGLLAATALAALAFERRRRIGAASGAGEVEAELRGAATPSRAELPRPRPARPDGRLPRGLARRCRRCTPCGSTTTPSPSSSPRPSPTRSASGAPTTTARPGCATTSSPTSRGGRGDPLPRAGQPRRRPRGPRRARRPRVGRRRRRHRGRPPRGQRGRGGDRAAERHRLLGHGHAGHRLRPARGPGRHRRRAHPRSSRTSPPRSTRSSSRSRRSAPTC